MMRPEKVLAQCPSVGWQQGLDTAPTHGTSARRRGSNASNSKTGQALGTVMLTAARHADLLTATADDLPAWASYRCETQRGPFVSHKTL